MKGGLKSGFSILFEQELSRLSARLGISEYSWTEIGLVSAEEANDQWNKILVVWQTRWNTNANGHWTHSSFPQVRRTPEIPLEVDHYVAQLLTGHENYNAKLNSFRFRGSGAYGCCTEDEMVDHVLFRCTELAVARDRLVREIGGDVWLCLAEMFLNTKSNYCALRRFAREALNAKKLSDR